MSLPAPYWQDETITLYHGDARHLLPMLQADCIVTDPPYGETSIDWDRWQDGWPTLALTASRQMWCFGSLRMFMMNSRDFAEWKLAQDVVWEKHNGSNAAKDRFRRMHELAVHFYQGKWADLYKAPVVTHGAAVRAFRRRKGPPHWGRMGEGSYDSEDGLRLAGSVIYARSCHGSAIHPTQKPDAIISPLIEYSTPAGGTVLDCFAGSGSVLTVARKLGRRAIGVEAMEEYCERIAERLAQKELIA